MRAALLAWLIALPRLAAAAEVANLHVWSGPERTQVVIDLSSPVAHNVFALANPDRIVVDLPNTSARRSLALPERRGVVDAVRTGERSGGALRLVLELNRAADMRSELLPPSGRDGYRLVIDLTPNGSAGAAAVARQAAPRAVDTPAPAVAARPVAPSAASPAPTPVKQAAAVRGRGRDVVIAIDAGHGGQDPGASGRNGGREKDVVLGIARRLAEEIDAQPGMRAVLTRSGDYFVTHRKRMEIAHAASADFFISIHADAYRDSSAKGSTVYVLSEKGATDEAALLLAQRENASDLIGGVSLAEMDTTLARVLLDLSQNAALSASIAAGQRLIKRMAAVGTMRRVQVQQAPFLVLKSPDIPSVLVETAYISNPREEAALRSPQHQAALAKSLRDGIVDYFAANPPQGSYFALNTVERAPQTVRHVITRGETLSGIAERYRVSPAVLRRSNSLKTDQVRVGQILMIPPG